MINERFINEPQWPRGGFSFARPVDDRNFDVNEFGQPVHSEPVGNWQRGNIVRRYTPSFRPPMLGYYAYDPTDPSSWHQSQI